MRALVLCLLTLPLAAATYPPHYEWRTITTDHFFIHFHQGEEELARRAAAIAEQAHRDLVPIVGWESAERTHLILTDHVDVANGSATPFPMNRMEIYVSAPGADPSSPIEYYDDWLNLVITHEYAHILHLDQARGFAGAWRSVFGREIFLGFPNLWSPLWLTEGLATLLESELTDAGRLKGTYVDMVLRTAAIEGRFASEAQASGLSPFWPAGGARYFYGSKFLSWLSRKHGADKLRQYINEYSGNILPFRVNATAKDVYGTSIRSLWREWSDEQQAAYRAEGDALGPLTARKRITGTGYETKYPILSPDGTRLAYTHEGPFERPTIRVRDLGTGRDIATHRVNNGSALSWSPDGKHIAYSQLEIVGSTALLSDLYVWEIGGGTRRLTRGARLEDPSFTPDGASLIAVENRAGRNRIVEVTIAGGSIRPLITPAGYIQFSEPAVSHDGRRIAVAQWDAARIDIVVYDRATGRRITNVTGSLQRSTNASPRFSRDDRTIWFSSDLTGIPNLFAAGPGGISRLTNVYGGALYPTSNDGRRFYFSDYSSIGFDIAAFDAGPAHDIRPRRLAATVAGPPEPVANLESEPYSAWRSIRPRWWFPIFSVGAGAGDRTELTIGTSTSGGDVLGFHTYMAAAALTTFDGSSDAHYSLIYSYDRLYPTITLGAFRFDEDIVNVRSGDDVFTYTDTTQRLIAQITFPYRRYRWRTAAWAGFLRDDIDASRSSEVDFNDPAQFDIFRGTLQGIRAGASFDNTQRYAFSIAPENGVSFRVDHENLSRAVGSDASLQQWRGDLRGYLTIPYRRSPLGRHVLTGRLAGAHTSGAFVFQRDLRVGGVDDIGYPNLDIRELPVRGYANGTLRGDRAAIGSVEYLFPLWEIDRGPTTWPLFFNRLLGSLFMDAGRVWPGGDTIAAAGAEAGLDFHLGHVLPLRYRIGVAYPLRDPGKGELTFYAALSSGF
ncbi:MAG TPA: LpqB family beta-propeller domain-containing protein [Thermoanaerobaculia bacterium]|nr:LpqB family beta-propeller domain-containing protein [Thermoanaerobaculia bacterium]